MLKDKIKEIRKSKGITQKALGDMIGVHESTIRAYETVAIWRSAIIAVINKYK